MNSFRCCFLAVHAWVALHLCLLVFLVTDAKKIKPYPGSMGYIKWKIGDGDKETARMITEVRTLERRARAAPQGARPPARRMLS